jgi:hypothetical protein
MATFELRRQDPDAGELVATGDAEVGQSYIRVLDPGGGLLTTVTWDDLVAAHTPPVMFLVWPDGEPT